MSEDPAGALILARRLYAGTLALLPRHRRDEWGQSLQAFFDEASLQAYRRGGQPALWAQTTRSIADMTATAWRERIGDRMRLGALLAAVPHELHGALRGLRRTPSVALGAIVTIALGAGVGTALFVLVHAALLAPLPLVDADRLVSVSVRTRAAAPQSASYPEYLDWRDRTRTLAAVAGYSPTTVNVSGLETPIRAAATLVTANFFAVLGVPFAEGRAFDPGEEWEGRDAVAIVTDEFRRRHFAGAPTLVGREIRLGDRSYRIVGVLAKGFRFDLRPGDLFLPLGLRTLDLQRRDSRWLNVIGRRVADASPGVVRDELDRISASTGDSNRESPATPMVVPLRSAIVSGLGSTLWLLSAAALLLVAAAAASLGGLAVTRTLTRTREFAVRVAIGASQRAVMLAVVTELACLGAIGTVAAVAVGEGTVRAGVAWLPADITASAPYLQQSAPLLLVLAVSSLLVVIACAPAALLARRCLARTSTIGALRAGAAAARAGRSLPFAATLVAGQVAMAVVLLIGAGLLGRSVAGLLSVDPGFSTARLTAFGVSLPRSRYPDDAAVVTFFDALLQRVGAMANVDRAGTIDALPFTKDDGLVEVAADDKTHPATTAVIRIAGPGYLETLGLDAREGRLFDRRDLLGGVSVTVLSQTLADRLFGERAIGRRLQLTRSSGSFEVIGVVADVRMGELDRAIAPSFYVSSRQDPVRSIQLVVRSASSLDTLSPAVRSVVAGLDVEVPVYSVRTLQEARESTRGVAMRRVILYPLLLFALLAAAIAAVGVYALLGHLVADRTREIGVRLALGAAPEQVWRLLLRQGLAPVVTGTIAGALVAAILARALAHLWFGVRPLDPATFAAVAIAMVALGALACAGPARRAAQLDPARATDR